MFSLNRYSQRLRGLTAILLLTVFAVYGCDKDEKIVTSIDTDLIPPAAITSLRVVDTSTTTATLVWTAVGDDDWTGRAAEYDIRYSTEPIADSVWFEAFFCVGEPQPKLAGSIDTFCVTRLKPDTRYYFSVKALDEAGNSSPASNIVTERTTPSLYVTWERTLGRDAYYEADLAIASDESFVMGAEYDILNVDAYGNLLWTSGWFPEDYNYDIRHVETVSDGTVIISAESWPSWKFIRTDKMGNRIWTTELDLLSKQEMKCFISDPAGGFVGTGWASVYWQGQPDSLNFYYSFAMKINEEGQFQWITPLEDSTDTYGYSPRSIAALADGGYMVLDHYMRLFRIDRDGNLLWLRDIRDQFPKGGSYFGLTIAGTSDGGCVVSGALDYDDIYIAKIDDAGNLEWMRTCGGELSDMVFSIASVGDGYVIAGSTQSFGDEKGDIYLVKFHPQGKILWERTYGEVGKWERACKVLKAPDGGLVVGGIKGRDTDHMNDFYLIKTDPRGEL